MAAVRGIFTDHAPALFDERILKQRALDLQQFVLPDHGRLSALTPSPGSLALYEGSEGFPGRKRALISGLL